MFGVGFGINVGLLLGALLSQVRPAPAAVFVLPAVGAALCLIGLLFERKTK